MVPGFTCDITGEGDITKFEKYCMCSMIAWQGFLNPTVGAVYGRDPSSVSRYRNDWMPRLGIAGAYLSELDMELNHNWIPMEMAKELGKAYFDEDNISFNIDLSAD